MNNDTGHKRADELSHNAVEAPPPKRSWRRRLLESVSEFPFHAAGVAAAVPALVILLLTYLRAAPQAEAARGLQMTGIDTAILGAVVALSATVAVLQAALSKKSDGDRSESAKFRAEVMTSIQDIRTELRRIRADADVAHERIVSIEQSLIGTALPTAHVSPNTSDEWARSAAGTEWWAVAPRGLRDVTWQVKPDGSIGCEVAESRMMPWLDRIGRNAVSRFTVILFTPVSVEAFQSAPEEVRQRFLRPIATQLASFRAARVLAAKHGVRLHLDRVQFVIRADPDWLKKPSVFIGATRLASGVVPYAITYTNYRGVYPEIPVTYLDDQITTWFEPNLVIAHRHLAEQLLLGQTIWTLDDIENTFGALCPQPTIKRDVPASQGASLAPAPKAMPVSDDWVTSWDGHDGHIPNMPRTPQR